MAGLCQTRGFQPRKPYMKPEYLRPKGIKRPKGFSQGVRFGDYIFVSGQMAWNRDGKIADKANFRGQFEVGDLIFTSGLVARSRAGRPVGKGDARVRLENIFTNMREVLKLGGVGLKDIIKVNMYLTSPIYIPTWVEVRDRHFGKRTPPPTSATVVVPSLVSPDDVAELEAVAVVPSRNPS